MTKRLPLHPVLLCLATGVWLSVIGVAGAQAQSTPLKPISIAYTVSLVSEKYGNATLGRAETTLRKTKQGYSVISATKAQGMAAILMGSNIQESCDFMVDDGRAVSTTYAGGRSANNDYEVSFDWQERKINFSDGESLDMPQGYVVDNCNLPFATALLKGEGLSGETVYVVDGKKKRIRGYTLKSSDREILTTKFGDIDTLKIVLERELVPERTFTLWLSPENSYVPLKMEERRPSRATTMMVDQIDS
ncbi:MAG: DUF3108 domain-containing protein [Gammaproteobacteria bacterium]|nr:DUF3108 domain-containing protein [Gammaproteobacteria bacterium]